MISRRSLNVTCKRAEYKEKAPSTCQKSQYIAIFAPIPSLFYYKKPKNRILLGFPLFCLFLFPIFAPKSQYIGIMTLQEIGKSIRERRKKLGISQQTLADLACVAVNTVVAIERGEGNPQLTTLQTILDTLGLRMNIDIKQLDYETM